MGQTSVNKPFSKRSELFPRGLFHQQPQSVKHQFPAGSTASAVAQLQAGTSMFAQHRRYLPG
jgi:hypothetical protein